jgi:hypothetical protein
MNMSKIITIFPASESDGVNPSERPTVPYAETASKMILRTGAFSVMLSTVTATAIVMTENANITSARLRTKNGRRLLKIIILFCPVIIAITLDHKTPMVVVLTPPPVEPGDAPINISIIIIKIEGVLSNVKLIELNPAVLDVTALNAAVVILVMP